MSKRRLIRVVLANAALTVLLLLSIELLLRRYGPPVYRRTSPGMTELRPAYWVEPDSELGWTVARGRAWGIEGKKIFYHINRQGFRHGEDFDSMSQEALGKRRVAVLGNSFTFGVHVYENETFPFHLSQRIGPEWEVINLGVPGYGIDQMVLAYEKHRASLQADIVLLAFIDEDIERVFEAFRNRENLPKPSFELVRGELIERRTEEARISDALLYKSRIANIIYSRWYRPRQSMRISEAFLHRLAALAATDGAQLFLVRYPRLEQLDGRAAYEPLSFEESLVARGVKYLEPFQRLRQESDHRTLYIPGDGHPTSKGNRVVADVIYTQWPN